MYNMFAYRTVKIDVNAAICCKNVYHGIFFFLLCLYIIYYIFLYNNNSRIFRLNL